MRGRRGIPRPWSFRRFRTFLRRTGLQVATVVLALCILTGGEIESLCAVNLRADVGEGVSHSLTKASPFSENSSLSLSSLLGDDSSFSISSLFGEVSGFFGDLFGSILGGGEEEEGSWTYVGRPSYLEEIPEYTGEPYVRLPGRGDFTKEEFSREPYEYYGPLDKYGRCTVAEALLDISLMPTQEREAIGMIKPTGWHTVKYDCIEDRYLYNRCHLLGFQLTGENANERNLITGTRYMNVTGMLPWENMLANFIRYSDDQCLYRVTPIYEGSNLVASGLHMEAESVHTDDLWFNIYVFNVQPGVGIDYRNGDSWELR
ncbi:MAG: DNA/RNA non-specific endonuclease [Blautia sp.]|nr:DNA/RNA non-specific endonuclease [Blautia sp.]